MNRMRGENKGGRDDGSAVGVGGHSNGFTGSGDVDGGQDTKMGGLATKFKMSPGRGAPLVGTPAVCDPGGPGGGLKVEPMDTSSPSDPSPESLNRDGLQVLLRTTWYYLVLLGTTWYICQTLFCF